MFLVGGILQSLGHKRKRVGSQPDLPGPGDRAKPGSIIEAIQQALEAAEREREVRAVPRMPTASPVDDSSEEMVEETESLEVEPETRTLEDLTPRLQRQVIDQEDDAEQLLKQRVKWSEERAKPIGPAEHRAFDRRIEAATAAKVAAAVSAEAAGRAARAGELRKMVICPAHATR